MRLAFIVLVILLYSYRYRCFALALYLQGVTMSDVDTDKQAVVSGRDCFW